MCKTCHVTKEKENKNMTGEEANDETPREIYRRYTENTTLHGIKHATNSNYRVLRRYVVYSLILFSVSSLWNKLTQSIHEGDMLLFLVERDNLRCNQGNRSKGLQRVICENSLAMKQRISACVCLHQVSQVGCKRCDIPTKYMFMCIYVFTFRIIWIICFIGMICLFGYFMGDQLDQLLRHPKSTKISIENKIPLGKHCFSSFWSFSKITLTHSHMSYNCDSIFPFSSLTDTSMSFITLYLLLWSEYQYHWK